MCTGSLTAGDNFQSQSGTQMSKRTHGTERCPIADQLQMTHSVHSWLTTMGRPQCQNHDKSHAQLRNSEQRHRVELGFFPGSAFAHTARPIQRKLAYGMTLQKIAIFCFGDTFQFAQYKIAHEAISATFGKYERHNLLSRCGGRNQAPTAARNVP